MINVHYYYYYLRQPLSLPHRPYLRQPWSLPHRPYLCQPWSLPQRPYFSISHGPYLTDPISVSHSPYLTDPISVSHGPYLTDPTSVSHGPYLTDHIAGQWHSLTASTCNSPCGWTSMDQQYSSQLACRQTLVQISCSLPRISQLWIKEHDWPCPSQQCWLSECRLTLVVTAAWATGSRYLPAPKWKPLCIKQVPHTSDSPSSTL